MKIRGKLFWISVQLAYTAVGYETQLEWSLIIESKKEMANWKKVLEV